MATLNEYIFSKATNKRPASPANSSSTLTGYIVNKIQGGEESTQSFEEQLDKAFQMLGKKTSAIKREQFKQITIATNLLEKQQDAQKLIADILNLTEERTALEKQFYQRIIEGQEPQEAQPVQEEPVAVPEPEPQEEEQQSEPQKLAAGGTTQVTTPTEERNNLNERDKQIKFADVMQLQPKASGIAAVSILGEFLSSLGPLAGFFRPYVKNIATPFAISMGVGQSIINSLLGGPVQAGELKTKEYQKDFGKTWSKFLGDENFISLFIDRVTTGMFGAVDEPTSTGQWGPMLDLISSGEGGYESVNPSLRRPEIKDMNLSQLIEFQKESIRKNGGSAAIGRYQFINPKLAYDLAGISPNEKFTPANQDKMAIAYLEKKRRGKEWLDGEITTREYIEDLAREWGAFRSYSGFVLPNNSGKIGPEKIEAALTKVKGKSFEKGGTEGQQRSQLTPYLLSGPEAGYDVSIHGHNVTMHGDEVVVPFGNGFQVFPVMNRRYNIMEDPIGVIDRWRQIAHGSNTNMTAFSAGGTADFWKIAALASKEDSLNPQGQADVAQALYNRSAIGSYPGGKSLGAIITAPGQFEPTFHNAGAWASIRDRKSAIAAAGNAQKVDMAVKSITSPSLQKEAQRFIGGRTDFMGESQKKHMKPGDVTRGPRYNFHGWFYDAKLPKPAPIPKVVSAQTIKPAAGSSNKPKIIVNQVGGGSSPSFVQQVQQTISRLIPVPVFNSHRLRTELNMKRSK